MKTMYCTAVGSRKAPSTALHDAVEVGLTLKRLCITVRSGRAKGMDYHFEIGVTETPGVWAENDIEIYLPQNGFRGAYDGPGYIDVTQLSNYDEARRMAADIHPRWATLDDFSQKLHTRNMYQVLGRDLATPSDLEVLWAPPLSGDRVAGGTNSAYQLAKRHNVPTFNLAVAEQKQALREYFQSLTDERYCAA